MMAGTQRASRCKPAKSEQMDVKSRFNSGRLIGRVSLVEEFNLSNKHEHALLKDTTVVICGHCIRQLARIF